MKKLLFFALILFSLGSCKNLEPFTQDLYEREGWTESDLRKIQFYLSQEVTLKRQKVDDDTEIKEGEVQMKSGRQIEEVVIPKGTPGVLIEIPSKNLFHISFDTDDNKYLVFGPNINRGNKYVILAKNWRNRVGQLKYDRKTYTIDSNSALASILVNVKKLRSIQKTTKKAKGRKL